MSIRAAIRLFVHAVITTTLVCAFTVAQSANGAANANQSLATGTWKKQEPLPTPWYFYDVDMISATEGWAVSHPITGDHATIFHTVDGGKSWKRQGGLFRQLNGIAFSDALHGVAVGNEFRFTTDGGKTWQSPNLITGTMYDVDMVDQNTAYASGFGLVQKTTDGGITWTSQSVPLLGNFVGIDFVDATTGWVVGAEGSVYKTTDGGSSWVRQRHDTSKFYTGVSFISGTEGWVCGNSTILHTTDGGTTWTTQSVPAGADAVEVRFVDSQNGWAAGALRSILHTTNGGQTWTLQLGGVYNEPNNRYPFNGLDAVDAGFAIAVGGGNSIYTTNNGGAQWISRGSGSGTRPFRFARTDADHIWTANNDSEVLYSVNGGKKWDRSIIQLTIQCDTCSNAADLVFLSNNEGWAVINGLYTSTSWVWHTIDGGKTWQSLNVLNTGPLTGIALVDANTLVAVSGANDLIFRSTDRGTTWNSVSHPSGGTWFGAVRFVPGTQTGWTIGEGGKILKTTDGGASWTLQRNASHANNLLDVSFADLNNGWAVGGEQLHTADGGATWVKQNTGLSTSYSVYAVTPAVAYVGGTQDLARTTDAGGTWTIERPSNTAWFCLNFLDTDNGWAGGQDQVIDDVPGSIWKRTASGSAIGTQLTATGQLSSPDRAPVQQVPPSTPAATK
jgi:photosystem II stability/assembly factor-like uncharacterized protein